MAVVAVLVTGAATLLSPLFANPAWANGTSHHDQAADSGVDQLVVRIVLLTAGVVVAGIGVFAPFTKSPAGRLRLPAGIAAGLAVVAGLPGFNRTDLRLFVLFLHLALTVAVPLLLQEVRLACAAGLLLTGLLGFEAAFAYEGLARGAGVAHVVGAVAWIGATAVVAAATAKERGRLAKRLLPYAAGAAIVVAGTGVLSAQLSGLRLDERLLTSGFGRIVLVKCAIVVVLAGLGVYLFRRRAAPVHAVRFAAISLTGALVAGTALAAVPVVAADPGVPLFRQVDLAGVRTPVLVTPHRPGRNLVHIGGSDPASVAAGLDTGALRQAATRAGSNGAWVTVDLPAGRSTLLLRRNGETTKLVLDAGRQGRAPAGATGPDGPECASAVLGRLLAGAQPPQPLACPADRLDPPDAAAVRGMAAQLVTRKVRSVVLLADDSPRSQLAGQAVRAALARAHVAVRTSGTRGDALIVLTGWSPAAVRLAEVSARQDRTSTFPYGIYLAPWLLTDPVVGSAASVLLPLRFDPHAREPSTYAALVREAFPGEAPSAVGLQAWLAERPDRPARLYTASRLAFLPKQFQHHENDQGWLRGGTVVPASGPLAP
ncbi:hypothetical protein [Flindersiella endophytica]